MNGLGFFQFPLRRKICIKLNERDLFSGKQTQAKHRGAEVHSDSCYPKLFSVAPAPPRGREPGASRGTCPTRAGLCGLRMARAAPGALPAETGLVVWVKPVQPWGFWFKVWLHEQK